jgi:hypothetical protein
MDDELVALERTLTLLGLRPSAVALAALNNHLNQLVERKLSSLGGDLLASHGPNSTSPDSQLASLGGYLLGHDWS